MRTSRLFVAVCVAIGLAVAFAAPTLAHDGPPPSYHPCESGHKKTCPTTTTTTAPDPETTTTTAPEPETTTTTVPEETTTTTVPGPPEEPETPLPVDELPPLPATPIVTPPPFTG